MEKNKNHILQTVSLTILALLMTGCNSASPKEVESVVSEEKAVSQLEGKWMWEKTTMNDGATTLPKKIEAFTITFDPTENKITGTTDCNNFFGSYESIAEKISFGPMGMTRKFCPDSQEMEFSKMIAESTSYMFTEDNKLVLLIKFDSGSVIFKRVQE